MLSLSALLLPVQAIRSRSLVVATMATAALLGCGTAPVQAGLTLSGSSTGVISSVNVTALGIPTSLSLLPESGVAPTNYTNTGTLASGSLGLTGVVSTTTGLITSTAASDISTGAITGSANGSTTINNLNLALLGLLTIKANTLTTSSTVSGTAGSLMATGAFSTPAVEGLQVFFGIFNVTSTVNLQQGAFVNVSAALGITAATIEIGLDIKTFSGDGINSAGITSDNLIIQIATLAGTSGTIVVGESTAYVQTNAVVPEPSSIAMTVVGLTGAFAFRRKRGLAQA